LRGFPDSCELLRFELHRASDLCCARLSRISDPNSTFVWQTVKPPEGFGGLIPEDTEADGPLSTDSEDEEPVEQDKTSWSTVGSKAETRDASFRQRTKEKVDRAASLKARSDMLASHLVTPAQHNRSVLDHHKLQGTPLIGSRTVATTPRVLKPVKEAGTGERREPSFRGSSFGESSFTKRNKMPDKASRARALDSLSALAKGK
jgi:hypothetical protein